MPHITLSDRSPLLFPRLRSCAALLTLLACCLSPLLAAGGAIQGRVVDPAGAPVPFAEVLLFAPGGDTPLKTLTSLTGEFQFARLAPGRWRIEAVAPGFARVSPRDILLTAGQTASVELSLELDRVSTQIVVTASGAPQTVDELSKSLTVFDRQEADQRQEFLLSDLLRLTPGVRVQQSGGPGALVKIRARGLRAEDTSILLDGQRFRDPAGPKGDASAFLSDLLLVNLERAEFLRGSGSSLYGTNAIGGVVNLQSDTGGGPWHGELTAEGGSLGLARGAARLAGDAFEQRLRLAGGLTHVNVTRGIEGDTPYRNNFGHVFLQASLSTAWSLSARLTGGDVFAQLLDSPAAAPDALLPPGVGPVTALALPLSSQRLREARSPFSWGGATFAPGMRDPDYRRLARFLTSLGALTYAPSGRFRWRTSHQNMLARRSFRDGPAGAGFEPQFNSADFFHGQIDTLNSTLDFAWNPSHVLRAGYEWELERYSNSSRNADPNPTSRVDARARARQSSHTVFLQNQTRWLQDRLQISLAGRLQAFSLSQPEFLGGFPPYAGLRFPAAPRAWTGDASLAFLLTRNTKLRAHAGNGYRAPSLYERFGASFFQGFYSALGDPGLRPERSLSFDAGIDQWLAAGRLRLSLTWFHTRLQEVIAFDFSGRISPERDPYGRFFGYLNTRGGRARGAEFIAQTSPTRSLDLRASYTFTDATERESQVADPTFLRSFGFSRHLVQLFANQRLGKRWNLALDFVGGSQYVFPFFTFAGPRPFLFDGPRRADASLSYTIPISDRRSLQLYGRFENLGNVTYFEDGFRTPRFTAAGGLKWKF